MSRNQLGLEHHVPKSTGIGVGGVSFDRSHALLPEMRVIGNDALFDPAILEGCCDFDMAAQYGPRGVAGNRPYPGPPVATRPGVWILALTRTIPRTNAHDPSH